MKNKGFKYDYKMNAKERRNLRRSWKKDLPPLVIDIPFDKVLTAWGATKSTKIFVPRFKPVLRNV